jgi:hypothetical protein
MNSPAVSAKLLTLMGAVPTEAGTTLFFDEVRIDLVAHGDDFGIHWTGRVGTNAWQPVYSVADCLLLIHQHGRQQARREPVRPAADAVAV